MGMVKGNTLFGRALKRQGVDTMFYIMGGPINDALLSAMGEGVRGIDCRHEQAAAMAAQAPVAFTQRCQAHAAVGLGSPLHAASATNSRPTCGVPMIAGSLVMTGTVSARATAGAARSPIPARTAEARHPKRACVEQTSMTARILRLRVHRGNTWT